MKEYYNFYLLIEINQIQIKKKKRIELGNIHDWIGIPDPEHSI